MFVHFFRQICIMTYLQYSVFLSTLSQDLVQIAVFHCKSNYPCVATEGQALLFTKHMWPFCIYSLHHISIVPVFIMTDKATQNNVNFFCVSVAIGFLIMKKIYHQAFLPYMCTLHWETTASHCKSVVSLKCSVKYLLRDM